MTQDKAETGNLEQLLSRVGAGLDEYLKFKPPDAHVDRDRWRAQDGIEHSLDDFGIPYFNYGVDQLNPPS